jgi:hypothetical protein
MATTLDVTLSTALQSEFTAAPGAGNENATLYEVYFDQNATTGVVTTLAENGTLTSGTVASIVLPDSLISGKIYFVAGSETLGSTVDLSTLITNQSNINPTTATADNFGYDSIELNLSGTSTDAGNLTSVNEFGLPMSIGVSYNNGSSASVGYAISGQSIVSALTAGSTSVTVGTYTSGALEGDFRTALPPTDPNDWSDYVTSLEGTQASQIILSGQFNGAEDASNTYHNGGYFSYQLSWQEASGGTPGDGNGDFWLTPLAGSQIQGNIQLTPAELEDSIYQTGGNAQIYTDKTDSTPYETMNTGANNQWGAVLRDLILGFNAGYFGSTGTPINGQASGSVDLNNSVNWDPTYAFGNSLVSHPALSQWFNPYAEVFGNDSNSYGFGYSDALTAAYTSGPLISVVEPGTAADVSTISVNIFGQDETPSGYTPPTINNYIAPPAGGYAVPTGTSGNNIVLTFNAAQTGTNVGVVMDKTATIMLKVLVSDTGGTPVWTDVTFDGATAGADGLWQQWQISGSQAEGYTAAALPGTTEPTGSLLINGMPVNATGGVSWYQITETGAADPTGKSFNLYLTTNSSGQFYNPSYAGQGADAAVDGLGIVQGPAGSQYANTMTFDLAGSSGNATDPLLNVQNTDSSYIDNHLTQPDAPVAGTISGGVFVALAGQGNQTSNSITTGAQGLEFGWTGENSDPNTVSWITGYTNKINAEDVALIRIETLGGGSIVTVSGTADIDGNWQTGPVYLDPGSYDITMQEYLPSDTAFATPVGAGSQILELTETNPPYNGVLIGLVTVPSTLPSDINSALQMVLTTANSAITAGTLGLTNIDLATNTTFATTILGGVLEYTNTDSLGAVGAGGITTGAFTVGAGIDALVVQAPDDFSITGNGTTSIALFGANSNVAYSVLTGSGSIFAAGGADSINIGAFGDTLTYSIYTSGNDTVNLNSGFDTVDATGNSSTTLFLANAQATVTSADNSTVSVVFQPLSGGTLDFINQSSGAATIYTGAYTLPGGGREFATNAVTAYGGGGGGFYVGGYAGNNSLIGGLGTVTLQGANAGDVLSVTGGDGNQLFSGQGAETLGATSASGANTFQLNLKYVGVGTITGSDVVSTQGSGLQAYLLGAGDSTITGSTVTGASNIFDLIRDASVGSASYTLTNFASMSSANFFITNGSGQGGDASVQSITTGIFSGTEVTTVILSDQTTIKFDGLASSNLSVGTDTTSGVISISYHA